MTKSEVRSVCLSKLQLTAGRRLLGRRRGHRLGRHRDGAAGMRAAASAPSKSARQDALTLLQQNTTPPSAQENLRPRPRQQRRRPAAQLPAPTHAFLGGTGRQAAGDPGSCILAQEPARAHRGDGRHARIRRRADRRACGNFESCGLRLGCPVSPKPRAAGGYLSPDGRRRTPSASFTLQNGGDTSMKWSLVSPCCSASLHRSSRSATRTGLPHPVDRHRQADFRSGAVFPAALPKNTRGEILAGGLIWFFTAAISTAVPVLLFAAQRISVYLRLALESVMCWQILAAKSLQGESMKVYAALKTATLPDAQRASVHDRRARHAERLDEPGVARAAVETVAEEHHPTGSSRRFFISRSAVPGSAFSIRRSTRWTPCSAMSSRPLRNIWLDSGEARRCVQFHPRAALGAFPAGGRRAFASGCQKRLADVPARPLQARKPQLCAARVGLRRASGASAGRRCVVPRGAAQEGLHRRRKAEVSPEDIPRACRLMYAAAALALFVFALVKAILIF